MSHTKEFVRGLIGGIVEFVGAFCALALGALDKAVFGSGTMSGLGVSPFMFAAVSIVGAIVDKLKPKPGDWLLLRSGVGTLISINLFGVLPALLLVPTGLMRIRKEPHSTVLQGSPKDFPFFADSSSRATHQLRRQFQFRQLSATRSRSAARV